MPLKLAAVVFMNCSSPKLAVVVNVPLLSLVAVPLSCKLPLTKAPSTGALTVRPGLLFTGTATVMVLLPPKRSTALMTMLWLPEPAAAASTVKR